MFGQNNHYHDHSDNENSDGSDNQESVGGDAVSAFAKVIGILLVIVFFLPSIALGFGVHKLLTIGRLRLSVIAGFLFILNIISFGLWNAFGGLGDTWASLQDLNVPELGSVLPTLISVNILVGSIAGIIACWWSIHNLKKTPHLKQIENSWMYHFNFRRTPIEWMKRRKKIEGLKIGRYQHPEKAPLGITDSLDDRVVYRYYSEAVRQTLVTGSAGSGKTATIMSLINNDIKMGRPLLIIDFKNDPEFSSNVATWANENNREFYHFARGEPRNYGIASNPLGQCTYDPLENGSAGAKADMVLGMREYDSNAAVYKANMQQLLQVIFNALETVENHENLEMREHMKKLAPKIKWSAGGIEKLASVVEGDNLQDLAIACEGTAAAKNIQEVVDAVKGRTGLSHAREELQGQLRTIIASHYGPWLTSQDNVRNIDIGELTKPSKDPKGSGQDSVVMFSIDSDDEPDFSSYMGSLILSDITSLSARRRGMGAKNHVNVYVDEFQAVPPESVMALLEKSRASYIGMTLSLQSFEQIIKASPTQGDSFLGSILDTCSNFIIHAGSTEPSAIRLSEIQGKIEKTKYSASNKNENFFGRFNWANRRKQLVQTSSHYDWITPPDKFMDLEIPSAANGFKSTAMILQKSVSDPRYSHHKGSMARKTWMIPPVEVLQSTRDPEQAKRNYEERQIKLLDDSESIEEQFEDKPPVYNEPSVLPSPLSKNKMRAEEPDDDDGGFTYSTVDDDEEHVYEETIPAIRTRPKTSSNSSAQNKTEDEFNALVNNPNFVPDSKNLRPESELNDKPIEKGLPKPSPKTR